MQPNLQGFSINTGDAKQAKRNAADHDPNSFLEKRTREGQRA
jgi:hypothetical protein